jgi:hypothetical protein
MWILNTEGTILEKKNEFLHYVFCNILSSVLLIFFLLVNPNDNAKGSRKCHVGYGTSRKTIFLLYAFSSLRRPDVTKIEASETQPAPKVVKRERGEGDTDHVGEITQLKVRSCPNCMSNYSANSKKLP